MITAAIVMYGIGFRGADEPHGGMRRFGTLVLGAAVGILVFAVNR